MKQLIALVIFLAINLSPAQAKELFTIKNNAGGFISFSDTECSYMPGMKTLISFAENHKKEACYIFNKYYEVFILADDGHFFLMNLEESDIKLSEGI